jgi:predicted flap endonuclease-1-like 5' DNA nuclease
LTKEDLIMYAQIYSLMLAEEGSRGGIPWWVWVILIIILLVLLWFWFGRDEEEVTDVETPVVETKDEVEEEAATPVKPDDLKKIEGIGPKVSSLLNDAGIITFQDMVEAGAEKLEGILDEAGLQMIDADTWPEQAKLAAVGDWGALSALQEKLKGGKRS